MIRIAGGLLSLLFFSTGCGHQERYEPAKSRLEKAITYQEQAIRESKGRPLSAPANDQEPTQVPNPALVDIESKILIAINKEKLGESQPGAQATQDAAPLKEREELVMKLLDELAKLLELRKKAIDGYLKTRSVPLEELKVGNPILDAFLAFKKEYGVQEIRFLTAINLIFPRDSSERQAIIEAMKPLPGKPPLNLLSALQPFLEAEVRSLEDRQKALASQVQSKGLSLRMEAFLESSGAKTQRQAIHLENYDTLDQGKVERVDRLGLNLSPAELDDLKAVMKSSADVAAIAEKARKGQIGLKEAFGQLATTVGGRLGEVLTKMEGAWNSIDDFRKRSKEIKDTFAALKDQLATAAKGFAAEAEKTVRDALAKETTVATLLDLLDRLLEMRNRWKHPTSDEIPSLVADSLKLGNDVAAFLKTLANEDKAKAILDDLGKTINAAVVTLAADAQTKLIAIWDMSDAKKLLTAFLNDGKSVLAAMEAIQGILSVDSQMAPLPKDVHVPESFQVPLDKVKDTFIDLLRTPRKKGDRVQLRATLSQGLEELDRSTASFDIEEFGYHASLAPSVVLVRPQKLAAGDEQFNFAPSLSWMHHYTPRPEEGWCYSPPLRFLDPAVGIHVAFLSYIPDKSLEVGLGGTVSFWGDRLVAGAGYNLMGTRNNGRFYFFVGSSLIPLLQDLGLK